MTTGSISEESGPTSVSIRGASAYASAPSSRPDGEPIRSARASSSTPAYAVQSSSAHHARWVIHGGTPSTSPAAKNGPIGNR
jgi:hypothetical protein